MYATSFLRFFLICVHSILFATSYVSNVSSEKKIKMAFTLCLADEEQLPQIVKTLPYLTLQSSESV